MTITKTLRRLFRFGQSPDFEPLSYWETRHQSHFGTLKAVGHRQLSDAENAEQYVIKKKRITNLIQRYVDDPRGKTLLDAGCGVGVMTSSYVDLGFGVLGVDFSDTAIRSAQASGIHAQFLVSPLDRLDLNRRFDVITIIDVLLHVVDDATWCATLSALNRHLKPTGVLVILDRFARPGETWSPHCHPRSLAEYTEALADFDLGIVARERFDLAQEGSTKDLIAIVRNGRA